METPNNPLAFGMISNTYLKRLVVGIIGLAVMSWTFKWAKMLLLDYHGPWWTRLGVLLLPWLVVGLFLWISRRVWRPDELETLISHRATAFAFFGLFIVVVVIEQLQMAGFIPAFAWTDGRLALTMGGLLLAGIGWSKFRYL